jgi:uncharacterized protein YbjT (DUF2867 family)
MYLVTGATGNVGSEVVEQLLAERKSVRVFTRDAGKMARWGDRVEIATGDFQNPESFWSALAGVEAAFVMNQSPDVDAFRRLVAAAKSAGGPRIVFLSTLVANDPQMLIGQLHKQKEDAIRESGLHGRFLRPGGFMSNAYQWIGSIKAEGVVYNAMGDTRFPPVAPEDIAAVAVQALIDANLDGEVFELSGGELLSVAAQVAILSRVLGKPIRTVDVPVSAAIQNLVRAGVPQQMAAAVGQSFESVRNGRSVSVQGTVERVTGRPPMTYEVWARRHAARFAW